MKIKKFLTTSLSATALMLGLAACNGGGGSSAAVSSAATSSAATSSAASIASSAASATSTNPLAGKYTITVWVSEADVSLSSPYMDLCDSMRCPSQDL